MKLPTIKIDVAKLVTNPIFVSLAAMLCCALWGSATPVIKLGYEHLLPVRDTASTILFAGIRFFFSGIITVVLFSIARRTFLVPKRKNLGKVVTVSLFQTIIQYILFYVGLANTSGVKATILSGSSAFFAMLFSTLLFKMEKIDAKKIIGCLLGFVGIIVVNLNGLDLSVDLLGDGFCLLSAVSVAMSSTLTKIFSKDEDPVTISGYQFIFGGAVMVIIGLSFGGQISFESGTGIGILIYLAFLSAVAYSLWGILLKHNSVSKVTIFSFTTPVFGVLLTELLLREDSKTGIVNLILALVFVCAGILFLNYQKRTKENKT